MRVSQRLPRGDRLHHLEIGVEPQCPSTPGPGARLRSKTVITSSGRPTSSTRPLDKARAAAARWLQAERMMIAVSRAWNEDDEPAPLSVTSVAEPLRQDRKDRARPRWWRIAVPSPRTSQALQPRSSTPPAGTRCSRRARWRSPVPHGEAEDRRVHRGSPPGRLSAGSSSTQQPCALTPPRRAARKVAREGPCSRRSRVVSSSQASSCEPASAARAPATRATSTERSETSLKLSSSTRSRNGAVAPATARRRCPQPPRPT